MDTNRPLHLSIVTALFSLLMIAAASAGAASALSAPKATGRVDSREGAYLRKGSSTSTAAVGLLRDNTGLTIHKEVFKTRSSSSAADKWYYVTADGKKGYIRSDLVDSVKYGSANAKTTDAVNYRKGAGTGYPVAGTLGSGKTVKVILAANPVSSTQAASSVWYRVKVGSGSYYMCSAYVKLTGSSSSSSGKSSGASPAKTTAASSSGTKSSSAASTDAKFEAALKKQGFPESYKVKLRKLHKAHPNWVFTAYRTNVRWSDAVSRQSRNGASLVHSSYGSRYRRGSSQVEPGWYNANSTAVAYYMDPRNFLTEERIMMFEDLTYRPAYQTTSVVSTILAPSKLPSKGFKASLFVKAGAACKVSPVFLAARARQETGGGSDAINGVKVLGTRVYNPFNIGAFGGTNPLYNGLLYARTKGWTTQAKAVTGGAAELSKHYINKGQNTIYFQRFNVRNGAGNIGTHQYMTNIHAPYNEAYSTRTSYSKYGILKKPLVFEIPVYNSMPAKTKLP